MTDEKKLKLKIARDNLPFHMPVNHTLIWALVLKVFNVPEWAWGIIILWVVLLWITFIHDALTTKQKDVVGTMDAFVKETIEHENARGPKP